MQDGIIKGTGNSRLLKSAITEATTWEQFRAALIAGTLPIDLAGINADGWQQLATALSKGNLLSDTTAAKFFASVTGAETVDQVLSLLGNSVNPAKTETTTYIGTGTYGSGNPNSIAFENDPLLLFIYSNANGNGYFGVFVIGEDTSGSYFRSYGTSIKSGTLQGMYFAKTGNTLSWYTGNSSDQLNNSGVVYTCVALCKS